MEVATYLKTLVSYRRNSGSTVKMDAATFLETLVSKRRTFWFCCVELENKIPKDVVTI